MLLIDGQKRLRVRRRQGIINMSFQGQVWPAKQLARDLAFDPDLSKACHSKSHKRKRKPDFPFFLILSNNIGMISKREDYFFSPLPLISRYE